MSLKYFLVSAYYLLKAAVFILCLIIYSELVIYVFLFQKTFSSLTSGLSIFFKNHIFAFYIFSYFHLCWILLSLLFLSLYLLLYLIQFFSSWGRNLSYWYESLSHFWCNHLAINFLLSIALVAFHVFWYDVFLFSFSYKYFSFPLRVALWLMNTL